MAVAVVVVVVVAGNGNANANGSGSGNEIVWVFVLVCNPAHKLPQVWEKTSIGVEGTCGTVAAPRRRPDAEMDSYALARLLAIWCPGVRRLR